MQTPLIFKPATKAMGHVNFVVKFTLIILIVSLPLGFLSYALIKEINANISTTKREIQALEIVAHTYKLLYWMADYRDYRLLQRVNSSESLATIVLDKKELVNSSLGTLAEYIDEHRLLTPEAEAQLSIVQEKWHTLSKSRADVQGSVDTQFMRYDEIVKELELLVRVTSYESTLAHDQNPANFYLVNMLLNDVPNLNRELGKLRAYGAYALNLKGINNHSYELLGDVYDELSSAIAITEYGMQQANNKLGIETDFINLAQAVTTKSTELQDYLYENIIEASMIELSWHDYFSYTSSGIQVIATLTENIITSLHTNLEHRVNDQQQRLNLLLGIAVFLYFLVAYLVIGVFYSLKSVLDHFSAKAMELATGNLNTRLSQHSHDELNTLVVVFNNMAQQLQDNNDKLLQAEKMASMGRMIAGVAHEMNTPLGICITSTSFMQNELTTYQSKFDNQQLTKDDFVNLLNQSNQSIQLVEKNLQRCSSLIETFKQLNSFERISLQANVKITDLVVSSSKELLAANPHIEFNLPAPCELTFDTDCNLFSIVFKNILANAIEHGIAEREDGKVIISLVQLPEHLELTIQDNGCGMDRETRSKIFDPFYTQHRSSGKVGLGMHIVHIIVCQSLKGDIKIFSQADSGTSVKLTLPIHQITTEGQD